MSRTSSFKKLIVIILVFIGLGALVRMGTEMFGGDEKSVTSKKTILHLELKGVILNGKKFIKNIDKYADNEKVKAIVVEINSPGGAVGPSQEIYHAIKTVREELKKPVICVSTALMASGGYYAAAACDKIVVAPGALIGSIGVIMSFANLEKLYDWAHVSRYSITSGKFKDSGSEYRAMRDDEKALFQSMIDEVYAQFKKTVMDSRNLKEDVMLEYADGRVFTGSTAVKVGFADQEGYLQDAFDLAADVAQLGKDYEIFEIPKRKMSIFDLGETEEEDALNGVAQLLQGRSSEAIAESLTKKILRTEYLNQPLYLMPGYWE